MPYYCLYLLFCLFHCSVLFLLYRVCVPLCEGLGDRNKLIWFGLIKHISMAVKTGKSVHDFRFSGVYTPWMRFMFVCQHHIVIAVIFSILGGSLSNLGISRLLVFTAPSQINEWTNEWICDYSRTLDGAERRSTPIHADGTRAWNDQGRLWRP